MSTKVKGLIKGLRYISHQIFEEKEEEFQIGLPTDVKHVAHIGSDDPSANAPSWMNDFQGGKEAPSGNNTQPVEGESKSAANSKCGKARKHLIPKSRHNSIDIDPNAPKQKATRRHNRSSDPSADSSNHDSSTSGSRHRRRRGSNHGGESPSSQDMPPTGAKTTRRKPRNSEDGSVKRSSRRSSKGDSLTDISISDFGSESGAEIGPEIGPVA